MITLFFPCFNEEDNLKNFHHMLNSSLELIGNDYEILIVDDGSTDDTPNLLNDLMKKIPRLRVLRHQKNKGLGSAMKTGISESKGELFIPLDMDFSFHPKYIADMIRQKSTGDYDCIIGSPYLKNKRNDIDASRYLLSRLINLIYQRLFHTKLTGITGIFRLYKTSELKKMNLICNGYDINTEILANLLKKNKNICEIYVPLTKRKYGVSKMNLFKEAFNHYKLMVRILFGDLKKS